MKINYDTYPALAYLKKRSLGVMPVPMDGLVAKQEHPEMFHDLNDSFKKSLKSISGNIFYVSKPFYNAAEKAYSKLSRLYVDMMASNEHNFSASGVFLIDEVVVFFSNNFGEGQDNLDLFYMAMTRDGVLLEFYIIDKLRKEGVTGWSSEVISQTIFTDGEDLRNYLIARTVNIASIFMFIKYAEVETKAVLGKSKRRFGDPYRNDTDFTITHLDSKWFTNIVRSEGFSVRGHFRLQPKKINGEWTKELIWIADFEKHGYTSKARILNAE